MYKLINSITGNVKENPLPPSLSDTDQANKFTEFFTNKIQTIRDNLDHYPKYEPKRKEHKYQLTEF